MSMSVSIQIDKNELLAALKQAIVRRMNTSLPQSVVAIKQRLENLIDQLLVNSETYQSIQSGLLRSEFGLRDPSVALQAILSKLKQSIVVSSVPARISGNIITGGINIGMIQSDFQDLLSLSESEYKSGKYDIKWLDWLLTKGDSVIILDYAIKYDLTDLQKRSSRTGIAIMTEDNSGWRVPSAFSGVLQDNWIVRTFNVGVVENYVKKIVSEEIRRNF